MPTCMITALLTHSSLLQFPPATVLLALMWRAKASSSSSPSPFPHHAQQQPQSAADRGASEMARRVQTLLHAALLRPALLGKRAVTVAGDVARRLTKGGQVKGARDCLVAALQALESMGGGGGGAAGGGKGLGAAVSAGWMRTATAALQWLLSECYSQVGVHVQMWVCEWEDEGDRRHRQTHTTTATTHMHTFLTCAPNHTIANPQHNSSGTRRRPSPASTPWRRCRS